MCPVCGCARIHSNYLSVEKEYEEDHFMITTFTIIQAFIGLLLIIVVLLQFGKGAEQGAWMGSGGSQSIFSSSQQGNILTKFTTLLAVLFLANSVWLSKLSSDRAKDSLLDSETPIVSPLNSDKKEGQMDATLKESDNVPSKGQNQNTNVQGKDKGAFLIRPIDHLEQKTTTTT